MPKKKAAWTVMVYLAGDNNLTAECLFALTEMKKADPGEEINVIAQFDPHDEYLPTHRYKINRNGPQSSLSDDIIDTARFSRESREVRFQRESKPSRKLAKSRARNRKNVKSVLRRQNDLSSLQFEPESVTGDTDTGSPITLYNFLSFCIEKYRADHYMVVLSGHAGGTESDYLMKDESSKGSLTFNEMKEVFAQLKTDLKGQTIDIVGMDNCLMSMGEICYELRDLAQIVVGCESYSPASGWPYRQILERLKKDIADGNPSKRNEVQVEAAKGVVEEYVNFYSPYWMSGMSVTQSALDLRRVKRLRKNLDRLAASLERELNAEFGRKKVRGRTAKPRAFKDALVLAHWDAQSYNGESFVDLFDFCSCLERRTTSAKVTRECREMKDFIAKKFVLRSCYSGAAYQYSYGVSIYFPWARVSSNYANLDFVRDSNGKGWFSFLQTYTRLTRRLPRGIAAYRQHLRAKQADTESTNAIADDRMIDDRMIDDRMIDDRMIDDRMIDDRMIDDRMIDDRMIDDRMIDDRMIDDRMIDDRMMANAGGNRIHSMRNPPVTFFPVSCIRDRASVMKGLRHFFAERAAKRR